MIADSSNTTPVFVTNQPDWGETYSFDREFVTLVRKSKNESEQRARMRQKPRYAMSYMIAALTAAEFSVRRAKAIKALGAVIAVPIWHAWETVLDHTDGVITVDSAALALRPFKVGGMFYIESPTGSVAASFATITDIGASTIEHGSDSESPGGAMAVYPVNSRIYPVILGLGDENSFRFVTHETGRTSQMFDVMEL